MQSRTSNTPSPSRILPSGAAGYRDQLGKRTEERSRSRGGVPHYMKATKSSGTAVAMTDRMRNTTTTVSPDRGFSGVTKSLEKKKRAGSPFSKTTSKIKISKKSDTLKVSSELLQAAMT